MDYKKIYESKNDDIIEKLQKAIKAIGSNKNLAFNYPNVMTAKGYIEEVLRELSPSEQERYNKEKSVKDALIRTFMEWYKKIGQTGDRAIDDEIYERRQAVVEAERISEIFAIIEFGLKKNLKDLPGYTKMYDMCKSIYEDYKEEREKYGWELN